MTRRDLDSLFGESPARPSEPTRALPMRQYRNPADWAEEQQARTCKGCKGELLVTFPVSGAQEMICTRRRKDGKRRPHGKRCESYAEKLGGSK